MIVKQVKTDGTTEFEFICSLRMREGERDAEINRTVAEIIEQVRLEGDAAVAEYTRRFDGMCPPQFEAEGTFEVDRETLSLALLALKASNPALVSSLEKAADHIREFHQRQKQQGFIDAQENGVILGQRVRGLDRVGLYVPGGTAAYPSSVLMNAIPAKIAGVKELIMVTPPAKDGGANPNILAAAALAGVDRLFLMGGAQAVAALAFGTETVPRVDKIVGPGNIFVATAKKLLYGTVDIDMIAGPSEILIMADETADPAYLAADMMSQAEHDAMASAMLLTTSEKIAQATEKELERQSKLLGRQETIEKSLRDYGGIFVCDSADEMVALANHLAPEHLEVMMENPFEYLGRLDNAGSVFLGKYSPEPLGDYFAGPNHVLPTGGTARFFSPLSVDCFVKKSAYIYYTEDALFQAKEDIIRLADCEGLTAHANSIQVRFEQ